MMEWQQKFAAIQAFAGSYDTYICMRKPDDWYVSCGMSVGGNGMLHGKYGNGATPQAAVEDHWAQYEALPFDRYAVNRENKRARWNGFMWAEVSDEQATSILESNRTVKA